MNRTSVVSYADIRRWWRRTFRFLSSVRLAVILLMILILGIAVGTICEARFDAKVARAYVYQAPWFDVWMIVLGVNLAAAAFSRYPWKKHHAGFVITHAGIITLLVGALVGRIWGIEGTMTLFVGDGPSNRLVMDQQEVRVQEGPQTTAFPVALRYQRSLAGNAVALGTTQSGWTLAVTDYADRLLPISSPQAVGEGGAPAVRIRLWNMGQDVEEWLWPNDQENRTIDLGLITVECLFGSAPSVGPKNASVAEVGPVLHEVAATSASSLNTTPELPPGDRAVIYLSGQGNLSYYLQNGKGEVSRGTLEVGKPTATGWRNWQIEVAQVLPRAVPSTEFKPISKSTKMLSSERANLTDGIKVRFSRGAERVEEWLASGWQVDLLVPGEALRVSLGPKIYRLPVNLKLKGFEVERNDGSETPAGFKSTLEVRDAAGDVATGSCSMNEPMNFPDVLWRRWTGLTYKISQASWNPHDLHQSSLQILFDPGWLFKWVGSLMVCTGIFTMFYLRPPRSF
jgi:hypothetical protein